MERDVIAQLARSLRAWLNLLSVGTKPRRKSAQHSLTILRDQAPHYVPSLRYEPVVYHGSQVCPYCRHSNAATANFCNQCGARLIAKRVSIRACTK